MKEKPSLLESVMMHYMIPVLLVPAGLMIFVTASTRSFVGLLPAAAWCSLVWPQIEIGLLQINSRLLYLVPHRWRPWWWNLP